MKFTASAIARGVAITIDRLGAELRDELKPAVAQIAADLVELANRHDAEIERAGASLDALREGLPGVVHAECDHIRDALERDMHLTAERAFEAPPAWDAQTAYSPGDLVSCYVGRTYRLTAARGDMTREPGDHPDAWVRVGAAGFRVHKSKPAAPEAGDVYADDGAIFLHDGQRAKLMVPKIVTAGDVERHARPLFARLDGVQRSASELADQLRTVEIVARDGSSRAASLETENAAQAETITALRAQIEADRLQADTTAETVRLIAADCAAMRERVRELSERLDDVGA